MRTCQNCGKNLGDGDQFCTGCGAPQGASPSPSATVARSSLNPPARPAPAPSPAPSAAAAPPPVLPSLTAQSPLPPSGGAVPAAWNNTGGSAALGSIAFGAQGATAPEISLMSDERQLFEETFRPKLLAPHLLTYLTVTDKRIVVRHPNTIFGFIPLGYFVSSAPHSNVEQVDSGMKMHSTRLAAGTLLVLAGLYGLYSAKGYFGFSWGTFVVALLLLAVGIAVLFTAKAIGVIIHTGGSAMYALARGNQLSKVQETAQVVNRLLLETEQPRGH